MAHEDWGEGPWNKEEDHAVWVDPATDLDCMINRNASGGLCGYVGVPPTHPAHGRHYDDLRVAVHGGLTYAAACQEGGEICHIPEPGREHDIWWFGFDCGHWNDYLPGHEATMREVRAKDADVNGLSARIDALQGLMPDHFKPVYRDWDYVVTEVTGLAAQLAAIPSATALEP